MTIRKSSNTGIPFGNTEGRPASPSLGQPYFNGEVGRLELYSSTGWQNIVQETPGVSSATGTYNQSAGSGTFTVAGTNFVDGAIAYAVGTNGTEYQATTTTYNSLVQLTVVFSNLSAEYEPYDIKITNPSNLFGLLPDAFSINDSPVWSTTAGSLGTYTGSSIQLSATDDESDTITYSVTSGSLPTGLALSSSGLISGTATANAGTYTFTVSASDGINTAVTRSFSVVVPVIVTGGTLTSDSTYYYRSFSTTGSLTTNSSLNTDVLIVGGGGGGGNDVGSGGGAGGVVLKTNYTVPIGTYSIAIGSGGPGRANSTNTDPSSNYSGTNTTFNSLIAYGGGGAGSWNAVAASSGGSGGGGAVGYQGAHSLSGGAATQPSSSTGGYGNAGGTGTGSNGANEYSGAAGGGGAGGVGGNGSTNWNANGDTVVGAGGVGISISQFSLTGMGDPAFPGWYGGGGGASTDGGIGWGYGGKGGGGDGNNRRVAQGTGTGGYYYIDGKPNTGGGGGGGGSISGATYPGGNGNNGGPGGSGVFMIRYTKASVGG